MEAIKFNKYPIWDSLTRANPHPMYAQMRREAPIYEGTGSLGMNTFWFLTRYEDVQTALKHPHLGRDIRTNLPQEHVRKYFSEDPDPRFAVLNYHLLNQDPPNHTRLRALVHKAFTPKAIAALTPRIHAIADELLAELPTGEAFDLIEHYSYPLPITVIAEMLGVPASDRDTFRKWTRDLLNGDSVNAAVESVMEFVQYMNEMIELRRHTPQDDILTGLIHAAEGDDQLDHMELLSMIFLLLVAGHETTVNLISNGMLTLLNHPAQLVKLRGDMGLMPQAIEEILRYEGPVEIPMLRWAFEEVAIGGVTIPQGDVVVPCVMAANRDPAVFDAPDTFDITRQPNPHIAFGFGIHYCLGAPLARMEGQIALTHLLERFGTIELATDARTLAWNDNTLIHGLTALPVVCG